MRARLVHLFVPCLAALLAGCSRSSQEATSAVPTTRVIESGPVGSGGAPFERSKLDAAAMGWVTGFRAEAVDPSTGPWHSDMRLDNGTRLLMATSRTPELRFPSGFALPLGQILRDIPEAWRGVSVVAAASGTAVKVRTTIEFLPPTAPEAPPSAKRLYVLSLPITEGTGAGEAVPPPSEGDLVSGPGTHWQVPPGQKVTRARYSYVVPVDCTVHFGLAHLEDGAKYVQLQDLTDGKVLWRVDVGPAAIPVFSSETGFPLYREHEYEAEVLYENTGKAPLDAAAVLYLYYRPPGNQEFSYPYAPEEPGTAP